MSKMFTWMKQSKLSLLLALIVAVGLLVGGCGGSDSYTDHTVQKYTSTETPLIEPETLKEWMDQGLVNSGGFENVIILTVGSSTQFGTGSHYIPGAQPWMSDTELNITRDEALAPAGTSVLSGANIDEILQRSGVDRYTTIVISHSGSNMMNPSRAYFTLRYWGFPKERIKVLNGGNTAWMTAVTDNGWDPVIYGLVDQIETVLATNFSVREYNSLNANLRYSLGEMIQAVDQNILTPGAYNILDTRGGTITSKLTSATVDDHNAYYQGTGFKPLSEMQERLLNVLNVNPDVKTISHCASGMRCAPIFFVLDGLLNWETGLYDGSTNQWLAYMARAENPSGDPVLTGAALAAWKVLPSDIWRTDLFGRTQAVPEGGSVPPYAGRTQIDPTSRALYQTLDDPRANQIEVEDKEYMKPTTGPASGVQTGQASGC